MAVDLLSARFGALADPTRRAILARLVTGEASLKELAKPFNISPQAVSAPKVLEQAGLITRRRDAQSRALPHLTGRSEGHRRLAHALSPAVRRTFRSSGRLRATVASQGEKAWCQEIVPARRLLPHLTLSWSSNAYSTHRASSLSRPGASRDIWLSGGVERLFDHDSPIRTKGRLSMAIRHAWTGRKTLMPASLRRRLVAWKVPRRASGPSWQTRLPVARTAALRR